MFKKLVAALATVALTAGLSTVAIASASADDGVAAVTYSTSVAATQAKEEQASEEGKASEEEKAEEERAKEEQAKEEQAKEEQAKEEQAKEEQAKEEKAAKDKAPDEQATPVVDNVINIALTYMIGCAPDSTNTWRVLNRSKVMVLVYFTNGGVHKAEPGTTFFETKRDTQETMIISWGKDGSGVKPGRVVKAASGSDLPNTSPSCAILDPSASIAVTECRYDSNAKAAFREVLITFDNSKSNVPVAFTVPWFSFDKTLAAGETFTFSAANIWPKGGGYSVVANRTTFSLPIEGCVEPTKPADVVVTSVSPPTSFDCAAGRVNYTTTTSTTPYVFDAPTGTWVRGETVKAPTEPSKRAITADETIEHCAVIAPSASIAVSECSYDSDGKAAFRDVLITFDNSKSNVPVAFTVPWFSFDKTLAARETFTFSAANIWPKGGGYSVVANRTTFSLPIEGCVEPTKPADVVVTSVSPPTSFDCAAGRVNFTTTTSTTSYEFNISTVKWVAGNPVEGSPVPLGRLFTLEETAEHCATAAAEWPRASSCSTTDDQSPYTRWMHLMLDPSLEYSITNDQTDVKTNPTSNYVQLAVGNYTVRVAAASGYILSQGAREHWSVAVADSGSCAPTPTPTPSTVPTTGGSSTSPQGAGTGGDDILEASAVSKLPTLDLATDGGADNSGVDPAADSAADNAVDRVLRTGNQMLVNFGYVAIGALTVLLLYALIQLARRYRAAADQ